MKIEGIPEGWELVRIGQVVTGEWCIGNDGCARQWDMNPSISVNYIIIKRIKPPKPTYRPFANAAEFTPHRDRWISCVGIEGVYRIEMVKSNCVRVSGATSVSWGVAFNNYKFEDGTPFGIEVQP